MAKFFGWKKRSVPPPSPPPPEPPRSDADRAIDAIVERLLNDEHVNQRFIPDALERRVYHAVIGATIGVIREVAANSYVDFLGHRLSFSFEPLVRTE